MAGAHSSAKDLQGKRIMASAVGAAVGLGNLTELSYLQQNVISHVYGKALLFSVSRLAI